MLLSGGRVDELTIGRQEATAARGRCVASRREWGLLTRPRNLLDPGNTGRCTSNGGQAFEKEVTPVEVHPSLLTRTTR